MKRWKKLLVSLLTVSMTIGASTMSVMAADGYTYKVTLSAGNKGTINGQTKVEQDSVAGSTVTFNLKDVQVTDDKYYVKGIRLSGRDNEEALASPVFDNVTGDADYVVAYGIKKDMVAYTVNYQDASGKALVESQTFYGNVGDKPIVAYQYIENYIPDALALTKTLSNNVSENVFTFTYKPGATDRVVTTTTTITTTVPGTATPGTGTGNVGTAGGTTGGTTGGTAGTTGGTTGTTGGTTGTTGGTGTNANGANAAGTTTGNGDAQGTDATGGIGNGGPGNVTDNQGTEGTENGGTTQDAQGNEDTTTIGDEDTPKADQDLKDLDDEDVPKSDKDLDGNKEVKKSLPLVAGVGIGVAALAALAAGIVIVRKRVHR